MFIRELLIREAFALGLLIFCVWFAVRLVKKYNKKFIAFTLVAMIGLIFIGGACNALAVIANGGFMPVLIDGKFAKEAK